MTKLQHAFEKIHERFQQKKDYFKKRIERWKKKGNLERYQKEHTLLVEAEHALLEIEKEAQELSNFFLTTTPQNDANKKALRAKIKVFKARYKELKELTNPVWRQWTEAIVIALGVAFVIKTVIFGLYTVPSGSSERTILVGDKIWANKMVYFFQKPKRGEFIIFDNATFQFDQSSTLQRLWQKYIGICIPILGLEAGPENVVKRVIAIPGDTIEGRVEDGKPILYLNNKKLNEPYLNPYPLIKVRRTKGFIDSDYFGQFKILELLGLLYMVDPHVQVCTYDPSKSFSDQPYYKLNPDEVVRNILTGEVILIPPHTPTDADTFGPITLPAGKYWGMGDSRNNSGDSRYWGFIDESLIHGRASFIILSLDTSESFWFYDLIKHPVDFWTKHIRWNCFFKGLSTYYGRPDIAI